AASIFLASGPRLSPIDPAGGPAAWEADLGGEPNWVGYLEDRLIAATDDRLVALDFRQGTELWRLESAVEAGRGPANPFARRGSRDDDQDGPALVGPRIVGGRIVGLRGDRELVAIDGESGQVEWAYAPAEGTLNR